MPRIKITDLDNQSANLSEGELKHIKGGLLPAMPNRYIEQQPNHILIGLLVPAVQKVREAASR